MDLVMQFSVIGLVFLGTVGVGFWVSRLGKPYNTILFNIHKLIALVGVVLGLIRLVRLDPFVNFTLLVLVLIGLAFIGVLALFISGAFLSIQEEISGVVQVIHRVSSVVVALTSLAALYVLS
jgi:hypothetical protein